MKFLLIFSFFVCAVLLVGINLNKDKNFKDVNVNQKDEEEEKSGPGFVPAQDWFAKQRAFPFDEIPQDEYLKSVEYVKNEMPYSSNRDVVDWTLAGPINIEGRITTAVIDPVNPQIVYCGSANGGVWKSTNFCQTWTSIFDNQNTSSIGALAIDPNNPNIIYCGTGEANSLRSYYPGTGMYKSVNGGANWTFIGLDSSFCIGNIAINPSNSQEVYVASMGWTRRKNDQRGIYKSTNGGVNWSRSFFIADSVGAIDVAIDPSNPSRVFAAMWERQRREDYVKYGGIKSGLYLSTNSGASWSQVSGGFPINDATLGRISFDICRNSPQIMYALTAFANGNSRGLYKSTNDGVNWNQVNASGAASSNYAWFNRICKVHPTNPDVVICGGLNMEASVNGGTSFSTLPASHVDEHAVAFAPSNPGFLVLGNDGGIDYTTNAGLTWNESTTLPITQFYAGDISYLNPSTILGGTQDNGTIRTTGGLVWNEIYGGDGFYALVDYSNQQYVYASSQSGGLGRSTNGGSSFLGATSGLDLTYTNWMTPYVMDKNNPQILYCGTYKIFKTTNRMQSWTAISPDLTNGHVQNLGTITTVDVSKSNPNVIYCGTDDANVWVTQNSGTNWTKINNGLPYRWVTRVAVHPDSANVCYVTLSGYKVDSTGSHIFRTTNFGTNWTSVRGNLPDAPINDVIIDPNFTGTLFIGTDINVMVSTNWGTTWSVLAQGIPSNVPCHDLTLHNPTRKLVVWTHGRSAFQITLPVVLNTENSASEIPNSYELKQNYPNPFNPSTNLEFQIPKTELVKLTVYDISGKVIANLINKNLNQGTYRVQFNGNNLSSGVYFYKLTAGDFSQTRSMVLIK
ncbi:MAG TPA: T9SS type A sorting domain-containing protein [Ignavibacteria bacterium]|nr:T9SS type A sorting domain-containing protein [Ignavibacteria bacterium]